MTVLYQHIDTVLEKHRDLCHNLRNILLGKSPTDSNKPIWHLIRERWAKSWSVALSPFNLEDFGQFILFLRAAGYTLYNLAEDLPKFDFPNEAEKLKTYLAENSRMFLSSLKTIEVRHSICFENESPFFLISPLFLIQLAQFRRFEESPSHTVEIDSTDGARSSVEFNFKLS